MTEDNEQKKEDKKQCINPFIQRLVNSIGKKVVVEDYNGNRHEGKLLAYSQPYLNICMHIDNKIRFVKNISWFERACDESDLKPKKSGNNK